MGSIFSQNSAFLKMLKVLPTAAMSECIGLKSVATLWGLESLDNDMLNSLVIDCYQLSPEVGFILLFDYEKKIIKI